ncbi:hypothetical protein QBC40DRAFT_273330 [Triangularia verruculosa]|uniref:Arrestin-like N-terminal domain-containing protein n=1 Tax=Triangularia verruculosa TaxID=2587418 RepID=A0AAN6XT60_9PEZI|nr:hypothetical protein QBC40DRAFT_273330 [Triangularia verruculosa]
MAATASSTSASSAHDSNEFPPVTRDLPFPKSDIRVHLKDHYHAKIYTSGSPVKGRVTITTKRDVRFDSIQIVLIGNTKASFDGMSFPQEITHTFLKMVMPVPESSYPLPKVLETGETYTIPFNFVIPSQLTINACNHKRLSDQLQDHHVLLPPSMGGGWEKDDMAPRMTRVEYSVKARVLRETVSATGPRPEDTVVKKTRIMEGVHNIQVLPSTPEEPPLNITPKDRLYTMTKSKTLRKSFILSTKLGKITAEAHQPSAAVISSDGKSLVSRPSMRVSLTFDPEHPSNIASPPQITSVSGKLTAHTFFSSGTISDYPNLGEQWNTPYVTDRRGQFFTSVSLPPVSSLPEISWTQRMRNQRRDSGYGTESSSSSPPARKEKQNSPVYLTSTVDIPISLPTDKKTFVPTFHGCIASRVYTLSLSLNIGTSSEKKKKTNSRTRVSLTVPLQIAVEQPPSQGVASGLELPTFEEAQADEHLRPRVLQVMSEEMREEVERGRRNRDSWGTSPPVSSQNTGSSLATDSDGLPGYGGDVVGQGDTSRQSEEVDEDRLPGYGEVGGSAAWRRTVVADAA